MFGADTPLVMDALQIAVICFAIGAAVVWLMNRRRKAAGPGKSAPLTPGNLEDRVRNLERIATDRSADLADEIEALRKAPAKRENVQ